MRCPTLFLRLSVAVFGCSSENYFCRLWISRFFFSFFYFIPLFSSCHRFIGIFRVIVMCELRLPAICRWFCRRRRRSKFPICICICWIKMTCVVEHTYAYPRCANVSIGYILILIHGALNRFFFALYLSFAVAVAVHNSSCILLQIHIYMILIVI